MRTSNDGTASRLRVLVGIDDTDNLESPGTGFIARRLGTLLTSRAIADLQGITRHQLLVDPRIPYTSHNSSLCLDVTVESSRVAELAEFCADYLLRASAPGSDAGLCIAAWDGTSEAVAEFGRRAKRDVLTQRDAADLAEREGIRLTGLTGDHGGIIGALAAAGLRRSNMDGRFAWRPGVRETSGVVSAGHLLESTGIDEIRSLDGGGVKDGDTIDVGRWPRPVLIEGRAVLLVERTGGGNAICDWRLAPKELIKQY